MMDRQALFEKFLDFLQTSPTPPDYLEAEPSSIASFDPYQMVAEWIALRHEVKQQGKLLQASQTTLQKAVETLQIEQERQQELQDTHQGTPQIEQKALWRDLLTVVDALDQAYTHWQTQLDELVAAAPTPSSPKPWWQRFQAQPETDTDNTLRDILVSNQQGIDLIRRSLLDVLRQRQVIPIEAQGQPFNPQIMYAVGRQESSTIPENTVIQEVVRGYKWGDQVLREAQVIVAAKLNP
ncbi:nucleotide exchange factor GrpE [Oscillatoria sp. FACHB-1407]|uniref:nucleotide exchange factor GrpE n=1 Tax=Oscillatoria sp. FACHB-1407 TaxID=2692847 RepID=UPI001682E26E|nr:nucleotide exchange factor GrpE [Oscillatoria sp. FACHB-1407]MBD2459919.1 nucleotide exchange factor GrpE [Oscillatoria sp. FACHB-1407]